MAAPRDRRARGDGAAQTRAPPHRHIAASPTAGLPLVREYQTANCYTAGELRQAMARHGGNQSRAAQTLGLTVRQFGYRWKKLVASQG